MTNSSGFRAGSEMGNRKVIRSIAPFSGTRTALGAKSKKGQHKKKGGGVIGDRPTHIEACPRFPPDRSFAGKRSVVHRFVQQAAVGAQGFTLTSGHDQFLTVTNAVTGAAVPYVDSWRIKKNLDLGCVSSHCNFRSFCDHNSSWHRQ